MDASRIRRHFVAVMAKHLPPSGSTLRLLDLDGNSAAALAEERADLEIRQVPAADIRKLDIAPDSIDAVLAYDVDLRDALLKSCLSALRAGGRFIALHSRGAADESHLRQLREHGFVRILVEPALDELGVLIRGEKPHATADTLARIQSVARADANSLDHARFRGRYIHLLIQQRPNKPVWKLESGDEIAWRAAAIQRDRKTRLLAFSSLPKAVSFMQPAVLAGFIADINKIGKFSAITASACGWDLVINPTLETIEGDTPLFIDIDRALAEAPDE